MIRSLWLTSAFACVAAACATATPGSRPHDMSVAHHDQAAAAESATAQQHAAQYDPSATATRERCASGYPGSVSSDFDLDAICWTAVTNPTAVHQQQAEEHRHHAADHRKASAALREAEARACIGVAPDDQDMSPFEHVEDIVSVEPVQMNTPQAAAGVVVTFRPIRGMTVARLQHLVDCHLARNASLGHVVPEMPSCPLVPKGAQASVDSAGGRLVVTVTAADPAAARDIVARAARLRPSDASATLPTR